MHTYVCCYFAAIVKLLSLDSLSYLNIHCTYWSTFLFKMPAKETGGSNFVDLTLDDRFGYTRKTSYGYNQQLGNCPVKDEIEDAATADVDSKRGLEEIGWRKTQVEEQHKLREPSTYYNGIFTS